MVFPETYGADMRPYLLYRHGGKKQSQICLPPCLPGLLPAEINCAIMGKKWVGLCGRIQENVKNKQKIYKIYKMIVKNQHAQMEKEKDIL